MSLASDFIQSSAAKASDLRHRAVLKKATDNYFGKVQQSKATYLDWNHGREAARSIKWLAINQLDEMLERFESNAEKAGAIVHWAETSEEVHKILEALCARHNVRKIVKSKSMVTEEIHLNSFLEGRGMKVVETDLGEFIVQLRGEPPYHIITPVMHLTKEDVDETFHEKLGTPLGSSAEGLAGTARRVLREEYLTAEMGITGANFIVADSGAVSITENEGNARLSSSVPKIHVAISGIEKIIPRMEDLALFLPMLAVSGTGQKLTCYNTLISGPRRQNEIDGPDEFHIILLDNGRTNLLANATQREALHCIRCGACLNSCPVFRNVGGHAYGTTYQGPIGSVITPHLRGLDDWGHLASASSLCGACTDSCPVHIDLHRHLLEIRHDTTAGAKFSMVQQMILKIWAGVMRSDWLYAAASRLGRFGQKLVKAFELEGSILDPARNWTGTRKPPAIAAVTFKEWWKSRGNLAKN
jgi:L-lactate dehydrogenase complex protein LldF